MPDVPDGRADNDPVAQRDVRADRAALPRGDRGCAVGRERPPTVPRERQCRRGGGIARVGRAGAGGAHYRDRAWIRNLGAVYL